MSDTTSLKSLKHVSPSEIKANPENPRLVFRQEEMEALMRSIDAHGIQVPLTVFRDSNGYTLIDGERRWRCANKLNLRAIPVLVREKPSELENLVLMYNIHALREQWDYYTIASKLERIIQLYYEDNGTRPSETMLSELTGLSRGAIRRCQLIVDLPSRFKKLLRDELEKPKTQQKLTEDFFLEMEKSLKTVTRRITEYEPRIDEIRDTLVKKFQDGIIPAVTDFRHLSKIATAIDGLGVAHRTARRALDSVFDANRKTSIRDAYEATVQFGYTEQRVGRYATSLSDFIDSVFQEDKREELDDDLLNDLKQLYRRLRRLLES